MNINKDINEILAAIGDDTATRYLYAAAQKITEEARFLDNYGEFKLHWKGDLRKEYLDALKVLKGYGWKEPPSTHENFKQYVFVSRT